MFGVMIVLALIPGVSVVTVVTRSIAFGFTHGLATTMGIIVGDIIFIVMAIYGLSLIAEKLDGLFVFVKYLGGGYLIWLGLNLCRSKFRAAEASETGGSSLFSSFLTGLFVTLGDQKAIFFYMGFLPVFVDISRVSVLDTSIIILVAVLAVGMAKLGYVCLAGRAGYLFDSNMATKAINFAAGSVMIGTGIIVVAKT